MVKLVYFAWIRERIGKMDEAMSLPDNIVTIADLIAFLETLDDGYKAAFQVKDIIGVALDRNLSTHDTPIGGAYEIAFFPPMTGG